MIGTTTIMLLLLLLMMMRRMAPMRTVMIVPGDSQGDGVVVAMV